MLELIERNKEKMEIDAMSPLIWAYIGDCVYELYVRTYLIENTKLKPHELHIKSIKYVKASEQARILNKISIYLTEDEKEIVRRARNTKSHHIPQNAEPEDYMYATAFEGLIGYLYLNKLDQRILEILTLALDL